MAKWWESVEEKLGWGETEDQAKFRKYRQLGGKQPFDLWVRAGKPATPIEEGELPISPALMRGAEKPQTDALGNYLNYPEQGKVRIASTGKVMTIEAYKEYVKSEFKTRITDPDFPQEEAQKYLSVGAIPSLNISKELQKIVTDAIAKAQEPAKGEEGVGIAVASKEQIARELDYLKDIYGKNFNTLVAAVVKKLNAPPPAGYDTALSVNDALGLVVSDNIIQPAPIGKKNTQWIQIDNPDGSASQVLYQENEDGMWTRMEGQEPIISRPVPDVKAPYEMTDEEWQPLFDRYGITDPTQITAIKKAWGSATARTPEEAIESIWEAPVEEEEPWKPTIGDYSGWEQKPSPTGKGNVSVPYYTKPDGTKQYDWTSAISIEEEDEVAELPEGAEESYYDAEGYLWTWKDGEYVRGGYDPYREQFYAEPWAKEKPVTEIKTPAMPSWLKYFMDDVELEQTAKNTASWQSFYQDIAAKTQEPARWVGAVGQTGGFNQEWANEAHKGLVQNLEQVGRPAPTVEQFRREAAAEGIIGALDKYYRGTQFASSRQFVLPQQPEGKAWWQMQTFQPSAQTFSKFAPKEQESYTQYNPWWNPDVGRMPASMTRRQTLQRV